jgi:hypothetical protein
MSRFGKSIATFKGFLPRPRQEIARAAPEVRNKQRTSIIRRREIDGQSLQDNKKKAYQESLGVSRKLADHPRAVTSDIISMQEDMPD